MNPASSILSSSWRWKSHSKRKLAPSVVVALDCLGRMVLATYQNLKKWGYHIKPCSCIFNFSPPIYQVSLGQRHFLELEETDYFWGRHSCWKPKFNNCPKCNKVLNVITFGRICDKPPVQSLNSASALSCYSGHPYWDVWVTAVAPKNPLTSIHVTSQARWYQSASSYLKDLSREALAAKHYTNEQLASNDSWQNNEYADQYLSIYHWLRLLSAVDFGKMW